MKIAVYQFNGSTWSLFGSAYTINLGSTLGRSIETLSSNQVIYFGGGTNVRKYTFNGSVFSETLMTMPTTLGVSLSAARLAADRFVIQDGTTMRVYSLSGDVFTQEMSQTISTAPTYPSIGALNGTDVILCGGNTVSIYRIGTTIGLVGSSATTALTGSYASSVTVYNGSDFIVWSNGAFYSQQTLSYFTMAFALSAPYGII